jgi:acetoin utilization deacetylase AcuC-like enzyme
MRHLPIIHHHDYTADVPAHHRFPMQKFERLAKLLVEDGLVPFGFQQPEPITTDQLLLAHHSAYVQGVLSASLSAQDVRRIGFPLTPSVIRRALLASGGTLLTARHAIDVGLACNSAGGSHHAMADHGAGFCVFNDVAVACLVLLKQQPGLRIMTVDLDVHQGDGTASILANEPGVFTFSMHCDENWPIVKPPSDYDLPVSKGTGDLAYLALLQSTLPRLLDQFQPDLVFYIAGVDPHEHDKLGKLLLTDNGLIARERIVVNEVRGRNIALASVLGGGYSQDIDALARRHSLVFHACADFLCQSQ